MVCTGILGWTTVNIHSFIASQMHDTLLILLGGLLVVSGLVEYDGPWRASLDSSGSCWTDRACNRVMSTSHGGDWNLTFPYDSLPAFIKAYEGGADAVKGGVAHNSNIHSLSSNFVFLSFCNGINGVWLRLQGFKRQCWNGDAFKV